MSTNVRKRAERKAPAERAAQIAETAREIALDQGLGAVTLRAVAARAGVTPALVAHYAPSMDELVADTFTTIVQTELDEVVDLVAGEPTARARLQRLVETLFDEGRVDVTVVWVESWTLGRRNDPLAEAVRAAMDAWQQAVEQIIVAGTAAGEFTTDDPAAVAWQLIGMIDGLNAQALLRWGRPAERSSLTVRAVEAMLGGR
ncbi:TetR family transcriptional regulator C-terminal domain-containing protein [Actinocrispum wychmicini]|uniref:TetR family transcriptional regulator n=1 Tax=Actinocrispum wychmicini TaxID=1213861 RepID=A0A4R2JGC8_9PSEU|nr:TetR family transcriptional regulator C-terminal domain-containing protein [Actinocrispum wychmicini]TCO55966.1 TetR family transcriptional regulator [Actinocrispum wychmicini]